MLDISMFYEHLRMGDCHLNTCKECVKVRVREYRKNNIEHIMEYDRNRPNAKQRRENNKKRLIALKESNPGEYRKQVIAPKETYRVGNREKATARSRVADAIASGKLKNPGVCECCKKKARTEAHHPDYSKSLDVVWLCDHCHKEEHKRIRAEQRRNKCLTDPAS